MKPPSGRRKIFLFDTRVAYRRRGDSSLRSAKVILARARARACARERERERERESGAAVHASLVTHKKHTQDRYTAVLSCAASIIRQSRVPVPGRAITSATKRANASKPVSDRLIEEADGDPPMHDAAQVALESQSARGSSLFNLARGSRLPNEYSSIQSFQQQVVDCLPRRLARASFEPSPDQFPEE